MKIKITLGEILNKCNDWEEFCKKEGYSVWCVNEGGTDHEIELSEEEAKNYGLIKS